MYSKHIENIISTITAELQREAVNREEWRIDVVERFDTTSWMMTSHFDKTLFFVLETFGFLLSVFLL